MSEEGEINVTDMDKIAKLNSYRRLKKAESVLEKDLRDLFDKIKINVRALKIAGKIKLDRY